MVIYTQAELQALTPIRRTVEQRRPQQDRRDVFLCHAWDDRDGAAKELHDLLEANNVSVWFSEKDVRLGTVLLREIDRGLTKSCVGIVLVTPALLKRLEGEGIAAPEILYSPDRVLHPMRRTTPKSDPNPGWERITWDEALDEIAVKFNTIKSDNGAESVAFAVTSLSGSPISDNIDWIERFIRSFGSPNTAYATEICNWHKDHAHKYTFGTGILYPEYKNADTILLWGFNPTAVWLDQATQIAAARAGGATIIAVDPRNAGYARDADHWLRVLPGTDGVLALAIANILITKDAFNANFIRQWTNGPFLVREDNGEFLRACDTSAGGDKRYVFANPDGILCFLDKDTSDKDKDLLNAKLLGSVIVKTNSGTIHCRPAFDHYAQACKEYSVERAFRETSIPAEKIEAAANALISAERVAYYAWTGVGQHSNATQTDRAIAMLMALKGCYDTPGGNVAYTRHETNPATGFSQFPAGQIEKALGIKERPLGPPSQGWVTANDLNSAILHKKPYAVRALMVFGANIAISHAETQRAQDALKALEFHVHCDSIETPTARFADIFLPINTQWEREGLRVGFEVSQSAEELIQLREPMVPTRGESRSDADVVFDLAMRVGLSKEFYKGDIDAALSKMLEPTGVTLNELRNAPEGIMQPLSYRPKKYSETVDGKLRGFATDTGRVEIYSELFLRHGYPPVPSFDANLAYSDEYPLILTTAKSGYYTHSSHRHIPSLRKRAPEPVVEISGEYAEANGFAEGDLMRLITQVSEIRMKLHINNALHPRVAVASYGWWQGNSGLSLPSYDPFSEKGANYNRLITAENSDPLSGSVPHRSSRCRLSLADGVARTKPAWAGFVSASVVGVEEVAEDVTQVSIRLDDTSDLPDYLSGQHITLRTKITDDGAEVTRCYSLIGAAKNLGRQSYDIAVRRVLAPANHKNVPVGRMSWFINDRLALGSALFIKAPSRRFVMPEHSTDPVVLIAGGIGITPFLGYLETVARSAEQPRIHLVYANRNSLSHAYRDRIAMLQAHIPTLTILNIYSDPAPDDIETQTYDRAGFVTVEDILSDDLGAVPDVYQCGPPPMFAAVEAALDRVGHPAERIFKEAFVSPVSDRPLPKGPFNVTFDRRGTTIEWTQAWGSILDMAEAKGLILKSGCRAGQCESCSVRVLSGSAMHRTEVAIEEGGHCLTCQTVPSSNIVLDA